MALNNFRSVNLKIDKANDYFISNQFAKEGDYNGRKLVVQLTNGGLIQDQTGVALNLGWQHQKVGNKGLDPFVVIDATQGIFEIAYPAEMMQTGNVVAVIQVIESGKIVETRNFTIQVEASPIDESAIVSENSFTVLQNALLTVNEYDGRIAVIESNKADKADVATSFADVSAQLEQTMTQTEFDSWIATILDGSPSIFKDSFNQLNEDYPNGAAGVALVRETEPAKMYVWNGDLWQPFGDYLGIEIKDGSVTFNKLKASLLNTDDLKVTADTTGKTSKKMRHMVQYNTKGLLLRKAEVSFKVKITKGPFPTGVRVNLYGNDVGDINSTSLGIVSEGISPLVTYSELDRELTYNYTFAITGNLTPQYFLASLELMYNVVLNSEVKYEIKDYNLKINDTILPVYNHRPYAFDTASYSMVGGMEDGLITQRNLVSYLKEKDEFLTNANVQKTVRESIELSMLGKIPKEISFTGSTTDNNGLFTVLMFDIQKLLDTELTYIKNNEVFLSLTATNLVNSAGLSSQMFNNNNPSPTSLTGGQQFTNPIVYNLNSKTGYTKRFGFLTGTDRYLRLAVSSKWLNSNVNQSGTYSNINFKIGEIDLSPYFLEAYGLPAINPVYSLTTKNYEVIPANKEYVDENINTINEKLENMGIVSPLAEKTGDFIGDSITEENFRTAKNYHKYISERTGLTVVNHGISGSGWYNRYNVAASITMASSFFVLFLGTNDWGNVNDNNLPLGVFGDKTNATIAGCIYLTITGIQNKFPTTPIGIITPLPRSTSWGSDAVPNVQGYTLEQLANLEIQLAKHFSLPYLDLYHESNLPVWIPEANEYYFKAVGQTSGDGLHPNDAGHMLMSYKIQPWLENNLIKS